MQSRSPAAARRRSSPPCWRSASRPRTSCRTPRAAARRRSAPSIACRGRRERLVLRRESAAELEQRLRGDLAEAERAAADRSDETVRVLEDAARGRSGTARDAAEAHGQAAERARHAHARVAGLRAPTLDRCPGAPRRAACRTRRQSRQRSPEPPGARRVPTAVSSRSVPHGSGSACARSRRPRSSRR